MRMYEYECCTATAKTTYSAKYHALADRNGGVNVREGFVFLFDGRSEHKRLADVRERLLLALQEQLDRIEHYFVCEVLHLFGVCRGEQKSLDGLW